MLRLIPIFLFMMFILDPYQTVSTAAENGAITLAEAKRIADTAEAHARENGWNVVIAIVDAGGHHVLLRKMDGTQTASIDIATQKARTSALYRRPTKIFADRLAAGETALMALPDMMPFEGGLPIVRDGALIGAIGVSGVTAEQDGMIAKAGMDAL
jgi:glc operon protein GlcG